MANTVWSQYPAQKITFLTMIDELLNLWNRTAATVRNDIPLAGSPERCAMRVAVQDDRGEVLVLERLSRDQTNRRRSIAKVLAALADNGLALSLVYLPDADGDYVAEHRGESYMLAPLLPGGPPPRPESAEHAWRGKALAEFLMDMEQTAASLPHDLVDVLGPPLDLPAYAASLAETVRVREPSVHARLMPSLDRLAPFLESWGSLPLSLCHGDYHPLNVLWSENAVTGVIDWEFMGSKPTLYDAANCAGCVGSEGPAALTGGLVTTLIQTLQKSGRDMTLLPEIVASLRTAWLSEWLRRSDREMIDLELDYLDALTCNLDRLRCAWRIG